MRIPLYCVDCAKQQLEKNDISSMIPLETRIGEISDNGVYEVICEKGHKSYNIISNLKFEMLFEYGLNSLYDKYYSGAVSSITASLERFYEFFIKCCWRCNGLDFDVIDKSWKVMENQSERQLGAYIFAFSSLTKNFPLMLKEKDTSFRNKVIHKGKVPNREEAVDFAQVVYDIIEDALNILRSKIDEDIIKEVYEYYSPSNNNSELKEKNDVLTSNLLTVIDVLNPRNSPRDGRNGSILELLEKGVVFRSYNSLSFISPEESEKLQNQEK